MVKATKRTKQRKIVVNKKKVQKRSKTAKKPQMKLTTTSLSVCAQKYAVALTDPFAPEALQSCIPSMPSVPSHKVHAILRTDGAIGTQGIGFVAIMHCVSKDAPHLYYTDATFVGTTAITYAAASGLQIGYLSGLPYDNATLVSGVNLQARIVGSGVKFEYTGTTLNESGLVYALHAPNHESLNNSSIPGLGAFPETVIQRVSQRANLYLNGFPTSNQETIFAGGNTEETFGPYPWSKRASGGAFPANGTFAGGVAGAVVSLIMITGVPGQTFHIEAAVHHEYIGFSASALLTPTHSDAEGQSKVLQAVQRIPLLLAQEPECPPICQLKKTLVETAKEVVPVALDYLVGPVASRALQAGAAAVKRLFF
jgi:hypothetical protein